MTTLREQVKRIKIIKAILIAIKLQTTQIIVRNKAKEGKDKRIKQNCLKRVAVIIIETQLLKNLILISAKQNHSWKESWKKKIS